MSGNSVVISPAAGARQKLQLVPFTGRSFMALAGTNRIRLASLELFSPLKLPRHHHAESGGQNGQTT